MLVALRIKDLAIIESLELAFEPGFTALTGETGAGKSILIDALTLVLGGRASADFIRTGADTAEVEALFDLGRSPAAAEHLLAAGLIAEGADELVVRRVLSRSGKNRVWIAGKIESTGRLFELGRLLIDIYGQHEYQTLLQPDEHRGLLDAFGALAPKFAPYAAAYAQWRGIREELAALDLDERHKREREDLLRYRVQEIETARLSPEEDVKLAAERELLRHAGTLKSAGEAGLSYLYESDAAVVGGLRDLAGRLREAAQHDPGFAGPLGQVENASALLEDAAQELRRRADRIEDDPERLAAVEDRLHELKRLQRKYGQSVADVLAAGESARKELSALERGEERIKELGEQLAAAETEARLAAVELSAARRQAARSLAREVESELKRLGMDKTRFEARVTPSPELLPHGADAVAFYLSPNPGEELKPLERIASGGELSRIMLALRVLLSGAEGAQTLAFDEVDAGIGGAVAEAVGLRMRSLAEGRQVFCVTHLPQIAALSHHHFQVLKKQGRDRTWVEVKPLAETERVAEVARMLAGKDITEATRAHAEEMLARAGEQGKKKKSR
jgi:DNA repair protein RecN (Recombination protein N)